MKNDVTAHWDIKYFVPFMYLFVVESNKQISQNKWNVLDHYLHTTLTHVFFLDEHEKWTIINEVKQLSHSLTDIQKMAVIKDVAARIYISRDLYEMIVDDLNAIARSDKFVSVEEHSSMFFIRLHIKKDYITSQQKAVNISANVPVVEYIYR
ncbi:MAG: hypothetical protein H7259_03195 [Cytophagales bacterium]|nr:hypothetical protein [Cytophaga sp.]